VEVVLLHRVEEHDFHYRNEEDNENDRVNVDNLTWLLLLMHADNRVQK